MIIVTQRVRKSVQDNCKEALVLKIIIQLRQINYKTSFVMGEFNRAIVNNRRTMESKMKIVSI